MQKKHLIIIFALLSLPLIFVGVTLGIKNATKINSEDFQKLYWTSLRELNLETGQASQDLKKIIKSPVKVPGFVVPLDDEDQKLSEFLLVPSPQACIHVPPPPKNQMIFVKMKRGTAPKRDWGPVWIFGNLSIKESDSAYGAISFTMEADKSEPFKY